MRLTTQKIQAIRHAAQRVLGADARVGLFGSMAWAGYARSPKTSTGFADVL